MIDASKLDEWARKLADSVPAGVRELRQDVEKNLRAGLQGLFAKMDVVTREEFDVQSAVLARTRAKLEALEKQVAEFEARLKNNGG